MARTVLYDAQHALGGKLIDFHGWDMPVQFAGIVAEHQAVRSKAGTFDLGHMGRLLIDGPGALAFLGRRVCRRLDDAAPGVVRYGLVLADDGTVEDDVLVSREAADRFHVVVNASNKDKILGLWADHGVDVRITDRSADEAMIAIQGPQAAGILASLDLDPGPLKTYRFTDLPWRGTTVRLSRTGYTGEDGCECFLPTDRVEELFLVAIAAGARPCGLGARDTLRTEAGMPLYGNELDRTVTPVEAGLDFAIHREGSFIGAEALRRQLADGPARRLVGLVVPEKRVPRHGYAVLAGGLPVGTVTSGTLSPTLGKAIGMAYVATAHTAPGTALEVDIRGTRVAATVVPLPFYKRAR